MFAVMPISPWMYWPCVLLGSIFIGERVWRCCRAKRVRLIDVLVILTFVAIIVGLSVPSVARLPQACVDGKDQFQWAAALESADEAERKQAISALCEMLQSESAHWFVQDYALAALGRARAVEALPTLRGFEKNADDRFRKRLRETIDKIGRPADQTP